jgi:hypothetical protein
MILPGAIICIVLGYAVMIALPLVVSKSFHAAKTFLFSDGETLA